MNMRTRHNHVLVLLLTYYYSQWCCLVVSGQPNDGECPLICFSGSECKPGDASFEGHPKDAQGNELDIHIEKNINNYHCECPAGHTGVTCSIPFESCADEDNGHTCYHGGTCIPGQVDVLGNDQYYCDCTNANLNGTWFVGKYCEYEQETMCDAATNKFCVNDGLCKPNPSSGCICGGDFAGLQCEYRKEDLPPCELQCQNGGACQTGIGVGNDNSELEYCLCLPGFHGDLCEEDPGASCGLNKCYHGSECVQAGDGELYCDCTAAAISGKQYSGRFCEYEATTYCGDTQDYYCLNKGVCQDQGNGIFLCDCPPEWGGPSCEFESEEREHIIENCTLDCYNDGQCRKGAKEMSAIIGLGPELSHLANNGDETHSEYFEHCVCPSGFTGLKCEHAYEECGNGEHICLHGSTCTPPKDLSHPVWECDCEEAFREDYKYAGKFCQHHHTSTCTTSDSANSVYEGAVSLTFCVNDGVCMEVEDNGIRYPGCRCPEQYAGPHCELLKAEIHKSGPPLAEEPTGSAAIIFVLFVLSFVLITITTVVYLRYRGISRQNNHFIETAHIEPDATKAPMMEQVDFDDEDIMEDIELL